LLSPFGAKAKPESSRLSQKHEFSSPQVEPGHQKKLKFAVADILPVKNLIFSCLNLTHKLTRFPALKRAIMTYHIQVTPSGHEFTVENNEALLDAALRQGLNFPYGCRGGACRSCSAKLQSGQASYPDADIQAAETDALANGEILCCQVVANSDLTIEIEEVKGVEQIEVRRMPCRIEELQRMSGDVMKVKVKLPETERLQFLAGQYIDFILSDGRHRSFSIANAPHNDKYLEFHIRHIEGGEFTGKVFNTMHEKDLLRLEGPHGSFFLREDSARAMIFMAGGTGFAPIKSIIEHVIAENIQRPIYLYWGVRAKQDLYMHDLAQNWAEQYDHIKYIPVLSEPQPEDNWTGRTGFVHAAVGEDFPDMSMFDVYTCGPPVMIQSGIDLFTQQGLKTEHLYYDSFDFQK
jgi:CDP-4-dehydro-6-deoxyglucose reductase